MDKNKSSIFHLCAEYGNERAFNFLVDKYFKKHEDLIFSKNNRDETVFHTACKHGNLDIIKKLHEKLTSSKFYTENFLFNKNRDGYTCFHLACIRGNIVICEYFLNDLKMITFLEILDNKWNTPMHLAAANSEFFFKTSSIS